MGRGTAAFSSVLAALLLAVSGAPASAAPTRYSLAHGCYALTQGGGAVPGAATGPDAGDRAGALPALHARAAGSWPRAPAGGPGSTPAPSAAGDWRVDAAGGGTFTLTAQNGAATLRGVAFEQGDRLRAVPRGRAGRHRHAVQGRHELRRGRRPARGPHALDDLPVPRRALPLRQALGPVRHPLRLAQLLVDRGAAGARRADPELPQLRQPGPAARHRRLADARVVERHQPDLRGHVLEVDPARVDGRPADDGHEPEREPDPLPAAGQPPDRLRRDGHGPQQPAGDPRRCRTTSTPSPAARARASSRSSPTPSRRAASSTRGGWRSCWRSRSPSRSAARTSTAPTCDQRRSTRRSTSCTASASARCCC